MGYELSIQMRCMESNKRTIAKCAFSVLLLLKLTRLLPESTDMPKLISDVRSLLDEISGIPGSNNIYIHILHISLQKFERALTGNIIQSNSPDGGDETMEAVDAEMDFQSYVPKEFILDWNFPGLKFYWNPFGFGELFLDFGSSL